MAIFGNMSITNAGQNLYAKAQSGKPIVFTRMQLGSGQIGTQNPATLVSLVTPQFDVPISSITANTDLKTATVSGTINNSAINTAIYICEIALWAQDPDVGEILYSYASAGSQGDYMAPASQGAYSWNYQINAAVGNAANVTANISSLNYDYGIVISDTSFTVISGGNQKEINKSIDTKLKANADALASHSAENAIQLAGGTANSITVATDGNFQYTQFRKVSFKAIADNTGNVTINVDNKGVMPALKFDNSQLPAGAIKNGKVYDFYYDTTGNCFFLIAKASGNTIAAHVLANDTCSTDNGDIIGTMPNNGSLNYNSSAVSSQSIPVGYSNGGTISPIDISAGNDFIYDDTLTSVVGPGGSLVEKKAITVNRTSIYRTKISISNYITSGVTTAQIYKNGVAFGTQRSNTGTTIVAFTEDLSFNAGDRCSVYIKSTGDNGYLNEFALGISSNALNALSTKIV